MWRFISYTEDGGAPPYDYAKAPLAHDDLQIDIQRLDDYELLGRRNRREECGLHLFKKREENKRLKKPEKRPLPMSQAQRRFFLVYMAVTLSLTLGGIPVFASSDPLAVVNNLSDFVFSLIRAIGLILLGFGIVQIGLSLKSQDPSQRANGFLTLAGGVVITFAREILNLITG